VRAVRANHCPYLHTYMYIYRHKKARVTTSINYIYIKQKTEVINLVSTFYNFVYTLFIIYIMLILLKNFFSVILEFHNDRYIYEKYRTS